MSKQDDRLHLIHWLRNRPVDATHPEHLRAADLIERDGERIARLIRVCAEADGVIGERGARIADLEADRDSWRQQAHDRAMDAGKFAERIAELEAEVARLREGMKQCLLGEPPGDCYAAEAVELRAALAKAQKDAARFQWCLTEFGWREWYESLGIGPTTDGALIRAAIDSALARQDG